MNTPDSIEILLVEDNPDDLELTLRAFQRHHFANPVFTVEDGAEALDFLFCRGRYEQRSAASQPRLILLDLKMPKVTGFDVLRAVKANPLTASIPIVVFTSSKEDPDVKTAYELGANAYVVKPVEFAAFQEAISKLGFYWLLVNQLPR